MKVCKSYCVSSCFWHADRHPESGFTLLEIMVAMVVLTMIMTTAFGSLRLGERSWEAGLEHAGQTENLRTVTGVLQRTFSQVLPLHWTDQAKTYIAFSGNSQQLRFIAPAPLHHGATGLFEYTLLIKPHADSSQLVLYYRLHDPDRRGFETDNSDSQQVVLVDDVGTGGFTYYGSPVAADEPQWHTLWNNDAEAFPRLVRARIVPHDKQQPWPDLLLPLHAELVK